MPTKSGHCLRQFAEKSALLTSLIEPFDDQQLLEVTLLNASISEIDNLLIDIANSFLSRYITFNGNTLSPRLCTGSCVCEVVRSLLNDIETAASDEHL